ncbi:MAG: ABC transporter substrate-binding protein [Propionibacteriaceae bacterium]|jgi:raffinose/stachyose/melibiose transport system substrate-binding protein|nr:ABC transporter substrate-binding protein [Propionibacteriaceae bacterium]
MKRLTKLACLTLGAAVSVALMAGCSTGPGQPEPGAKPVVRLTYWNSEETMASMLRYISTAVPDVKVEFQFIDNTNYATIVDTQLAAGEGPDIIVEAPNSSRKHARQGYLEDLSTLAKGFSAAGNSVFTHENKVYGLPGVSWFEGTWFNKELFAKHNIALPTTFAEYIEVCKKFKELGIKPLAAGLQSWEPMLKNSMAYVTAEYLSTPAGSDFGEKYRNGQTTLDGTWNPYIDQWSALIRAGVYTKEMTGISHEQAMEEFASGKAAMFCSGPWDLDAILAKNPKLDLDMMPFHGTKASPDGTGWLIGGPGGGFAVNANSKVKPAAMKVLEAIATPEGQKALVADSKGSSSYLIGLDAGLPKYYNSVVSTIEAGKILCPWDDWGTAGGAHREYGVEMQKYLMGEVDIATALSNVDKTVKELLSK